METVTVDITDDHLRRLSSSGTPLGAIAELIWNGLDADANEVKVSINRNELGGIISIEVMDNGHGIRRDDAREAFGKLGGSRKSVSDRTPAGRILHGKEGKGRFRAFALGSHIVWRTRYGSDGHTFEYTITGDRRCIRDFQIADQVEGRSRLPGTVVLIEDLVQSPKGLSNPSAARQLTQDLALYLRQYPAVSVMYDGEAVDPRGIEDYVAEYEVSGIEVGGGSAETGILTVIEWTTKTPRHLYLCDSHGFTLDIAKAGIQARGFEFTAYLRSNLFRRLSQDGEPITEINPLVSALADAGRERLRSHFRDRSSQHAADLVKQWKKEEVYPYRDPPTTPTEVVERQAFDVIALAVNEYAPAFQRSPKRTRQLSFQLLREALRSSPAAVEKILRDVLALPVERQEEFARLLHRTSLEAIINASTTLAGRLDFLRGLELLVFDVDNKRDLLERSQLHKIVQDHAWLFGEEYHLSVSDRSLTEVLKAHLKDREIDVSDDEASVTRTDGARALVDLMFSRVMKPRPDEWDYLVVELKRPSVKIDTSVLDQTEGYAMAVASDERFHGVKTRWRFWAVSNEMNERAKAKANQADRPMGQTFKYEQGGVHFEVWAKTWSQILADCRARLDFFQRELNYKVTNDSALDFLRRTHAQYLPDNLRNSQ